MGEAEDIMQRSIEVDAEQIRPNDINDALRYAWRDIRSDKFVRETLRAAGVDLAILDAIDDAPFEVEPKIQGFEGVSTFCIAVTTGLAAKLTIAAAEALWEHAILPFLKARFGNSVEQSNGAAAGDD